MPADITHTVAELRAAAEHQQEQAAKLNGLPGSHYPVTVPHKVLLALCDAFERVVRNEAHVTELTAAEQERDALRDEVERRCEHCGAFAVRCVTADHCTSCELDRYEQRIAALEADLATRTKHWAEDECERERRLNTIAGLPVDGAGDVCGSLDEVIEVVLEKFAKARAEALREAADKWSQGEWACDVADWLRGLARGGEA